MRTYYRLNDKPPGAQALSDAVGSSVRLSGGTLIGATVPAGSTITGTTESTISGLTIAGTLDFQSFIAIIHVTGGLSLPGGRILLGDAGGSTFGQLRFSGASQTVDGTAAAPGMILFGANISSRAQVRSLVRKLQKARPAGAPPLLISTDQEGGLVKRFSGGAIE